ncbi:MAG: hypothetical protein Ta2F_14910 [Termitinemataceae bacterium]|nr:MAG: hypothetical protein Ta2F_14910 [Termitinemataceae bacterium]
MKKISIFVLLVTLFVIPCSAKAKTHPIKFEKALEILDENCKKYPWGYIVVNFQTKDDSPEACDLVRITHDSGEIYLLTLNKGGNRYEVRIEFVIPREDKVPANALRGPDINLSVRSNLNAVLPKVSTPAVSQ